MSFAARTAACLAVISCLAATPTPASARQVSAAPALARETSPAPALTQDPSQAKGLAQVDFFIGEWDVRALSADGSQVVGRARTEVRYILDGNAIQADYYALDPGGNTVFRGTTIRTYVPATDRFIVHWAMAGLPGYTYLEVEYRDGELHGEGHGVDLQGEFLERYRYFDLSDTTYAFEMSRSYDGGETWQPFSNLRATKRAAQPPAEMASSR